MTVTERCVSSTEAHPATFASEARVDLTNIFMIGRINYGTEGREQGPLTLLTIDLPGDVWDVSKFAIPTYPRKLTPEDTNPAGNWRKHDNPTYQNDGGIVVQTVHSGYLWNGAQLAADPLRAELQERGNQLAWQNIDVAEGASRRSRFRGAAFTLEQNGRKEQGKLIGIFHISPQATAKLEQAYIASKGGPVDLTDFADYNGPTLNPATDVIYFFCSEPYADEVIREGIDHISQGRELLIIRINK